MMLGFRPVRYRHSRRIRTELLHPQPEVDNFPLTTLRHDHAYEVVFPSKVVPDHGLQPMGRVHRAFAILCKLKGIRPTRSEAYLTGRTCSIHRLPFELLQSRHFALGIRRCLIIRSGSMWATMTPTGAW